MGIHRGDRPLNATRARALSPLGPSSRAVLLLAVVAFLAPDASVAAQNVEDPARLAGLQRVDVRAEASWDDLITMEAGGATPEQFLDALSQTFESAIATVDAAPSVVPGAPVTVACHVDTFYDTGLIVYSLRVQTERIGDDGDPVITWIKSWVGSYPVTQMHLMFRLGEVCADAFLDDWKSAN